MIEKEVSSPLLFAAFAAFLVATATTVASEVVDCPSALATIDLPFEAAGHICQHVWKEQDYILAYKKINENRWSFVLTTPNENAYIGIGFSETGGMVPSSAIVGWTRSSGVGMAWQYYLAGPQPNLVIPDSGNLTLVGDARIISTQRQLYLAFQLVFEDGNAPLDKLIYSLGPDGFVPGADNRLRYHQARISTTINYGLGMEMMMPPESSPPLPMAPESSSPLPMAPGLSPSHSMAPEVSPSHSMAPGPSPSHSMAPEVSPSHSMAPGPSPSHSMAPEVSPSHSMAPGPSPSHSMAPEGSPSHSMAPEGSPSHSMAPGPSTSHSMAPGPSTSHSMAPESNSSSPMAPGPTSTETTAGNPPPNSATMLPTNGYLVTIFWVVAIMLGTRLS